MTGRTLQEAVLMMVPEAFGPRYHISVDKRAFYRYHVKDPVYFYRDFRTTIQQMGGSQKKEVIGGQKGTHGQQGGGVHQNRTENGFFRGEDLPDLPAFFAAMVLSSVGRLNGIFVAQLIDA